MVKSNDTNQVKVVKVGEDTTKKRKRKKARSSTSPLKISRGRESAKEKVKNKRTKKQVTKPKKARSKRVVEKGPDLRRTLDPLREMLSELVNQANERVSNLRDEGLEKSSKALDEAQRSFNRLRSRKGEDELFRANLKTREQINREFARVHTFLNDYTSTPEGVTDIVSNISLLKGAFGGSWKKTTGENYDTTRVNKDIADEAFSFYRRVLERTGGWERAIGIIQGHETLAGYGSENLIIAIYDMVTKAREGKFDYENIIDTISDVIETGLHKYAMLASKQLSDEDYNLIFNDDGAEERKKFHFSNLNWRRK